MEKRDIRWVKDNIDYIGLIVTFLSLLGSIGLLSVFVKVDIPLWTTLLLITIVVGIACFLHRYSKYKQKENSEYAFLPEGGFAKVMKIMQDNYLWEVKMFRKDYNKYKNLGNDASLNIAGIMKDHFDRMLVEGPYCKGDFSRISSKPSIIGYIWECPTCEKKERKRFDTKSAEKKILERVKGKISREISGVENQEIIPVLLKFLGVY